MARSSSKRERSREAARDAVAQAGGSVAPAARDPFTGGLRRREVLPLLVLHFIAASPSYGNQLMERVSELTAGLVAVNPNTMYPLLRSLEARGLIRGEWEHPERRSRRFYRCTAEGREERDRLAGELRPRLDRIARSIDAIRGAVL